MEPIEANIYKDFVSILLGGYTILSGAIVYLFHQVNKLNHIVGKFEGAETATYEVVEKTLDTVDKAIKERDRTNH